MKLQRVRGTRDLLPPYSTRLRVLEEKFRYIAKLYGYDEVIPPTIEYYELFAVKSGEELKDSMYVFKDKANRVLALRPEVTASVARIFVNQLLDKPKPIRLFYICNCFRYDEPQYGRYREFFQAGVELIGLNEPYAEIEHILMLSDFLKLIDEKLVEKVKVKVNHIGILRKVLSIEGISEDIQDKIFSKLDKSLIDDALNLCKSVAKNTTRLISFLEELIELSNQKSPDCILLINEYKNIINKFYGNLYDIIQDLNSLEHLVQILTKHNGAVIKVVVNPVFARGLAYYTGIIYELISDEFPLSMAGGGRYDNLIKLYGGPQTPASGYAIGLDRLLLFLEKLNITKVFQEHEEIRKVAIIPLVQEAYNVGLKIATNIRQCKNIRVVVYPPEGNLKKVLSKVSSLRFDYAIILGQREIEKQQCTLRNLKTYTQISVPQDEVIRYIE